jgi:hypothetical protein
MQLALFNIENAGGRPISLRLPSFCVEQLLMTLPHLPSKVLPAQHGDASLRPVFALGDWRLEAAAGSKDFIRTESARCMTRELDPVSHG